jgi:hypothetical protein
MEMSSHQSHDYENYGHLRAVLRLRLLKTDHHVTPMLQRSFYDLTQVFSLALNPSASEREVAFEQAVAIKLIRIQFIRSRIQD